MQIFTDDGSTGEIEKVFAPIKDRDGAVVFLERKTAGRRRQELPGLDDALIHAPSGIPIVMLAWPSSVMFADDPRWHASLGYPNVVFRRLPEGLAEIATALDEATKKERPADPLAIALLGTQILQEELGILHHDLDSAQRSTERMAAWLERARKHLGYKTQKELVEIVTRPQESFASARQFEGQKFSDVCIDVEGTLFTKDGDFRATVLGDAEERAKLEGRPITIWTGGNLENARKKIRDVGIPYKIIPKEILEGATVGHVIDDCPEPIFREEYDICFGTYQHIRNFQI